jgi:hypothetical protein
LKDYKPNIYKVCKDEFQYLRNSKIEDKFDFVNQILKEFYDENDISKFTFPEIVNVTNSFI